MKSRYDNVPSKEARMENRDQSRLEAEHRAKNQFVKKVQSEQDKHAGRAPKMNGAMMDFNAYMSNNGEHAEELARDITAGLDKVAFPVR